jgi:catechol 1,2-dioxygenase
MKHLSRRNFLRTSASGLASLGVAGLVLRADAAPTAASGEAGEFQKYLAGERIPPLPEKGPEKLTEDNILGPFHRPGAPFRAKITPPAEPGQILVIRGRVWGHDTRRPLAGAVLDIWQANHEGKYDYEGPLADAPGELFKYRARVTADETGFYEYETIHPGYYTGRTKHIHYLVKHPGYKELVTQLYFKGDPRNASDRFYRESLAVDIVAEERGGVTIELGVFDIVLAPAGSRV